MGNPALFPNGGQLEWTLNRAETLARFGAILPAHLTDNESAARTVIAAIQGVNANSIMVTTETEVILRRIRVARNARGDRIATFGLEACVRLRVSYTVGGTSFSGAITVCRFSTPMNAPFIINLNAANP